MGVTQLIGNNWLIDGGKSDPHKNLDRETYPINHDIMYFDLLTI